MCKHRICHSDSFETFSCKIIRKFCKAVTVTDSVFTHGKLCIKLYIVNLDTRDNSYET